MVTEQENGFLDKFSPHDRKIIEGHIEYLKTKAGCGREIHGIKYLAGYFICPACGEGLPKRERL